MVVETAPRIGDPEDAWDQVEPPSMKSLGNIEHARARNTQRALYAGLGLAAYAERTRGEGEDIETALGDLLGDLRHLCDAYGIDFEAADARGHRYYTDELNGEG